MSVHSNHDGIGMFRIVAATLVLCCLACSILAQGNLILWNKMGSQYEVEHSEVGENGTWSGGSFGTGRFGQCYEAGPSEDALVTFPGSVVPTNRGCIEFWAKLANFPSSIGVGAYPGFVWLTDTADHHHHYNLSLNSNDGLGGGGLCARAGRLHESSAGSYGSWTYSQVLGAGQVSDWHHYALVWDESGISGVGNGTRNIAAFLDGALDSSHWGSPSGRRFMPLGGGVFEIVRTSSGLSQGTTFIDNLKIWDYAKTNFNDRFVEGPAGLILWNKLGSQHEVENSAVGEDGTFMGGGFTAGKFGNAYMAQYDEDGLVTFPKEVIPLAKGCVEFWARLVNPQSGPLNLSGHPLFFRIHDAAIPALPRYELMIHSNDGDGNGGLCGTAGYEYAAGTGPFGSWDYQDVFPTGTETNWHHYALAWDSSGVHGVAGGTRKVIIFLDGEVNSAHWNTEYDNGFPDWLTNPELQLCLNASAQGQTLMDNLKIWDYAKTDFSDRFVEGDTNVASLTVQASPTEHDQPAPHDYGEHTITKGTVVTNGVTSPADEAGGVRYACTGWTGAGSVPASGSGTSVAFTITNDSTVTWQWQTEYQLNTGTNGNGSVDVGDGWYAAGTPVTITATAGTPERFIQWLGNVPAGMATNNPLTVTMDQSRTITALFSAQLPAVAGTILYAGGETGTVWVAAYTDSTFGTDPVKSVLLPAVGPYVILDLEPGNYYLASAMLAGPQTNAVRIRPIDPWGTYGPYTNPTPVFLSGTGVVSGVDITLLDTDAAGAPNPFATVHAIADFDGDGVSDLGCYDGPGTLWQPPGSWYFMMSTEGFDASVVFGYAGTVPVVGDFDGDGLCDYGCYDAAGHYGQPPGSWYFMKSSEGFDASVVFGYADTVPVVGDFDGDGIDDFGCYDALGLYGQPPGSWYFMRSSEGFISPVSFGYPGTVPVVGDFDGDGKDDYGCYDARGMYGQPPGSWYFLLSNTGFARETFGYAGTIPIAGDFDGDGTDDFGCFDPAGNHGQPPGSWYFMKSTDGFDASVVFGYAGTVPVVGDFDGDGTDDYGCYDAAGMYGQPPGSWYLMMSTDGFQRATFGYDGTVPIGASPAAP